MSDHGITDPAAARAQAANLRAAAERVGELSRRLDQRVEGLDYEGPAATRFRTAMTERSQRARSLARDLETAADRLSHGASS